MSILETYRRLHARSAALYEQSTHMFPSGITHDARQAAPFPLYVERSSAARKWDADENELIDYWTGHGSLLLGHGHPAIVAAVQQQMARGTHYGAEHAMELRWGDLVKRLFPGIERLRFTASGTEATMLALRLARAYTRRPVVIRFEWHFHGWHDMLARDAEADGLPPGVAPGLLASTIVLPAEIERIEATLRTRNDIAAVILEPTGASYGLVPLPEGFLQQLRAITSEHGVLLICDEVVTGFRVAPGGAQARTGVTADLTTLAKILAGGLPGGAVGGRADIMRHLDFGDATWNREQKVRHNGTYNANPLSAAAGVTALELVASGEPGARAIATGQLLINRLNELFQERNLEGWAVYGDGSIFHMLAGAQNVAPGQIGAAIAPGELKRGGDQRQIDLMRMALINHGVDLMRGRSGFLSAAHSETEIDATVAAFAAALDDLAAER